ncbi:MAG: polysaccharide deacetylase family protein [Candidatus Hodarchaeota archaeon]
MVEVQIPILMYHNIHPAPDSLYTMPLAVFESQMSFLKENKYKTISLSQVIKLNKLNHNYILLTFDDGYIENYMYAFPILIRHGFHATFFVITNKIDTPGYMSWKHLDELANNGMEIGSHTLSHRALRTLDRISVLEELRISKSLIEAQLNRQVPFLSFPHGSFNRQILALAKEAGYMGCCTSRFGYYRSNIDPYKINRINIKGTYDLSIFRKIVTNDGFAVFALTILDRVKELIKAIPFFTQSIGPST